MMTYIAFTYELLCKHYLLQNHTKIGLRNLKISLMSIKHIDKVANFASNCC